VEFIFPVTEPYMRKLTKGEAMQDIVGRIIFTRGGGRKNCYFETLNAKRKFCSCWPKF